MAVLTSFSYARTRIRQGRTGQRVRLGAVVNAGTGSVFNLADRFGAYGRTSDRNGQPYFAWSNFGVPIPFEHDTAIAAPACTEPRFCWDQRRSLLLTCLDDTSVTVRRSDSDAYDWNTPTEIFTGAAHPDVSADRAGLILYAAYRSGALSIRRQYPGDSEPSLAFDADDDGGSPLVIEDSVFRIVADPRGFWHLHCLLDGETDTTLLTSTDDGASWGAAVTGIASGTHPGLCVTPSGDLVAWAYAGGSGFLTRRAPGDTSWSTPVEMEDDTSPLSFANQPFSITGAFEGAERLVLAAILSGDDLPTEMWSADAGQSWTAVPA